MNLKVSNTNSNGKNETAVRIYKDNELIAEVNQPARNSIRYIIERKGKYRNSLIEQCSEHGVNEVELTTALLNWGK